VLSEKHTIRFIFHDFASLPHACGEVTQSSSELCHGYQWKVQLYEYPGGDTDSDTKNVDLSLFLVCVSVNRDDCEVRAKFAIRVPSGGLSTGFFDKLFRNRERAWGRRKFLRQEKVLDPSKGFLVDGNLTIELDIQVYMDKLPAWEPIHCSWI
jgi:hypothetical protein